MKPAFQSWVCDSKGTSGDQATGRGSPPSPRHWGAWRCRGWGGFVQASPAPLQAGHSPHKHRLASHATSSGTSVWRKWACAPPSRRAQEFNEAVPQ